MSDDFFSCGCRGTVHEPTCMYWRRFERQTAPVVVNVSEPSQDDLRYGELQRKLDRIITLLEEIAGRRR